MTVVRWVRRDDEPGTRHLAEFASASDAEVFARLLRRHAAILADSISIETKINIS